MEPSNHTATDVDTDTAEPFPFVRLDTGMGPSLLRSARIEICVSHLLPPLCVAFASNSRRVQLFSNLMNELIIGLSRQIAKLLSRAQAHGL